MRDGREIKGRPAGYFVDAVALLAAAAGIMVMRFMTGGGMVCHPESSAFIQIYTDPEKTLLQTIYDPWHTDWNLYQARELSSLLDWCDVQIIKTCILNHHTHFFSVVSALLIVASVMVLHFGFRRWMPGLGRWGAALLSLLYAAAPANGSMMFFRSAKPAAAFGIAVAGIAAWSIFRRRKEPVSGQRGAWAALGISLFLLPYCDRQALYAVSVFAMAGGAFLLLLSLKRASEYFGVTASDRRRLSALTIVAAASAALAALYNLKIAPFLIEHLNGYRPSFEFQNVGGAGGIFNVNEGLIFLLDNIGFTVTGAGRAVSIAVGTFAVLLWLLLCFRRARKNAGGRLLLLTVAGVFLSMTVSADLMTARHDLILLPDVIHGGYFSPFLVTLIVLLAISIEVLCGGISDRLRPLIPALAAVSVAIHLFTAATAKLEPTGHLDIFIYFTPDLIRCLNDPSLDPEKVLMPYSYLQLCEHFRMLRQ